MATKQSVDKYGFKKAIDWIKTKEGKEAIEEAIKISTKEADNRDNNRKLTQQQWQEVFDL